MTDRSVYVLNGPDKPALQFALMYPERGLSVTFKTDDEVFEAQISEMIEMENGFSFDIKGRFCTGSLRGQPFHGTYSVGSRKGSLLLES